MALSKKKATIRENGIIELPLNLSQGSVRIADGTGNHHASPTKVKNERENYIEWMITNDEVKQLSSLLKKDRVDELIRKMSEIRKFAKDSDYSRRETCSREKKIADFQDFEVYEYADVFHSFEKVLDSKLRLKARITFKLGDYGVQAHPHMYVLIPFDFRSLRIKNKDGAVGENDILGSGCMAQLTLEENEIMHLILALAHASEYHRRDLINSLES